MYNIAYYFVNKKRFNNIEIYTQGLEKSSQCQFLDFVSFLQDSFGLFYKI